ncbi:hypothetical protein TSAR_010292, partial [Trichomalopsis sarcophagae]
MAGLNITASSRPAVVILIVLVWLYSLNAGENSGPLKQRRFSEDYRRDSKHHVPARTPLATRLSGLAVTDRPFSLSALKVTFKIRGVNSLLRSWQSRNNYKTTPNHGWIKYNSIFASGSRDPDCMGREYIKVLVWLYSLNAGENSGPLKQRRFSEDYRRDSKHHVPARTPLATRLSGLAVTDRPFSLSALKVTFKIRGVNSLLRSWQSRNNYKTTPNRISLKPLIALSIRAYESQMTEKHFVLI